MRSRLLSAFEAAEQEPDPERRAAWLTFVVVGAGPTGVEMAGQIAESARNTLRRDYRTIEPRTGRILLVEAADRILTAFPPSLSAKAEQSLQRLGVTVLPGQSVTGVDREGVLINDSAGGEPKRILSHTVIWAAGVTASSLASKLGELTGAHLDPAGRVTVEPDLTLPGHPEVFALGDMVRVRSPDGSALALPGVAPVAMQQGRYVCEGHPGPVTQQRQTAAVPLPGQRKPGHHWPSFGGRRRQGTEAQRLHRLDHLAARSSLVPGRLPKPRSRPHPLVVQLRHPRPRRPTDHRAGSGDPRERALASTVCWAGSSAGNLAGSTDCRDLRRKRSRGLQRRGGRRPRSSQILPGRGPIQFKRRERDRNADITVLRRRRRGVRIAARPRSVRSSSSVS